MDDQPIFVAAEIEDHAVVADEIDSRAELTLDIVRAAPICPRAGAPSSLIWSTL
jgi:hypothetical protein